MEANNEEATAKSLKILMFLAAVVLFSLLCWLLWAFVPRSSVRVQPVGCDRWHFCISWSVDMVSAERHSFTLQTKIRYMDALISGRQPEVERPYEG